MGSITSWCRLEPQVVDASLGSLAARVRDPLWLLARQWQFREWQGEDTGSAVEVRLAHATSRLTRYLPHLPTGAVGIRLPTDRPLEAVVEAEPAGPQGDLRLAASTGLAYVRALGPALAARYQAAYLGRYRLAGLSAVEAANADDRSTRLAKVLAGRAIDGVALHAELAPAVAAGKLPNLPAIDPSDAGDVLTAANAWLAWWDRQFPASTTDAWRPERLEHSFAVAAPAASGEVVLAAQSHRGGRVDWTAFDVQAGASLGAAGDARDPEQEVTVLPTGLSFPGMPAARWWQFEDAAVDFGTVEAAPDDLGRLLLTEFALVYGNDFFAVPLPLPVGTLTRVTRLEVTTTFGDTVQVPSAARFDAQVGGGQRWRAFHLATGIPDDDAGAGWLVLSPSAVDVQESEPIEEVLFSRDEIANVAWAVERRVTSPSGWAMDRHEAYHRARPDEEPPSADSVLRYRLATDVPPNWMPLVPVSAAGGRVRLELRGAQAPLGRLLAATGGAAFALAAEELPRSGRLVNRRNRRARWVDGSTVVWTGRQVRVGRGESSSGLRFDDITRA